jgi:hypothetical protein
MGHSLTGHTTKRWSQGEGAIWLSFILATVAGCGAGEVPRDSVARALPHLLIEQGDTDLGTC